MRIENMSAKPRRNDPCPCGSGKKYKNCCQDLPSPSTTSLGDDGLHVLYPGVAPSEQELRQATAQYQHNIRNSPIWDAMVKEYGKDRAEEMLKEFRVKPG